MKAQFRCLGRYLTRDGVTRPQLALILNPPSAMERALDAAHVKRRIEAEVQDAARHTQILAIGRVVRESEDTTTSLLATELRMNMLYVVDARTTEARLRTLASYAKAGVSGMLVYAGGPRLRDPSVARQVEDKFTDFSRALRWPLAVLAEGPLARYGVALRGIARNTDMSGVVLRPDELEGASPLPDLSVTARLLAARAEDRPAVLALEEVTAAQRATALALACGYGLVIAPRAAAPTLAPLFDAFPRDIANPKVEELGVFLFDEREGNPVGEDAIQGALSLMRRSTGLDARFCFQDRPDLPAPRMLWVAAHGALSAAAWTRLQCLARDGCHIVISGLCLDDEIQRRRLESLEIEAEVLDQDARPRLLADQRVLDCSMLADFIPCGGGGFSFTDRCHELAPKSEDAQHFARTCAARAGVSVASVDPGTHTRALDFANGRARCTLSPAKIDWSDS